jgi:3-oxoadipate enol-lactonase
VSLHHKLEGDGEHVVLLHPVGLDLTCWDSVAAQLTGRYRLLRLDLPGHGESPKVRRTMELADFAREVHNLVNDLNFAPTAVVGLSFGGMIAQAYALDFPQSVSKLIVAGCPCTLPAAARAALAARGRAGLEHGMSSQIEETLQRWFTPDFIASGGADAVRRRLSETDPVTWNNAWQAIANIDMAPRLNEIRVQTLCIAGDLDSASPPSALREIARYVPNAKVLVLSDTPHMMQIERPELMASALSAFLGGEAVGELSK